VARIPIHEINNLPQVGCPGLRALTLTSQTFAHVSRLDAVLQGRLHRGYCLKYPPTLPTPTSAHTNSHTSQQG